jgi:hypothetical protein
MAVMRFSKGPLSISETDTTILIRANSLLRTLGIIYASDIDQVNGIPSIFTSVTKEQNTSQSIYSFPLASIYALSKSTF